MLQSWGKERSQREVNKISYWCDANDMKINISKSLCIHSIEDDVSLYKCGMSSLPNAVSFKDIIRSKDGGYQYQASFAASKARRLCGMITNNLAIPACRTGWRICNTYEETGAFVWHYIARS